MAIDGFAGSKIVQFEKLAQLDSAIPGFVQNRRALAIPALRREIYLDDQ